MIGAAIDRGTESHVDMDSGTDTAADTDIDTDAEVMLPNPPSPFFCPVCRRVVCRRVAEPTWTY